jgi:hypothetical protein
VPELFKDVCFSENHVDILMIRWIFKYRGIANHGCFEVFDGYFIEALLVNPKDYLAETPLTKRPDDFVL